MTRRQWTTEVQADWLKERLAAFMDSQANKTTTKVFFPQVIKDWRKQWPLGAPTADQIAKAKNLEDAIKKKKTKDDKRIKAWFHNHTRGSTSGTGTRGILKMTSQTRLRQEWQVYQSMTYENKWKAIIDLEWDAYQNKWKADNPGTNVPQGRFAFMNSFLKAKYKEESEEVKNEVRERRAAMKAELDEEATQESERNKGYQSSIDKLPRTLTVMGESIFKQTGWHVTFLVGGPEPRQNGKIMTFMLNCGSTSDDQNFEQFLGEEAYEEHIIEPFDDFLHKAFPPDVRLARSIGGSKSSTPEAGIEDENGEEDEVEGDADNDANNMESKREGTSIEAIKSEYNRSREANIARNKELLREVEAQYPMDPLKKVDKKKGKEPREKKEKVHQEPTRSSARLQGPSDVPVAGTAEPAENTGVTGVTNNSESASTATEPSTSRTANHVDTPPSESAPPQPISKTASTATEGNRKASATSPVDAPLDAPPQPLAETASTATEGSSTPPAVNSETTAPPNQVDTASPAPVHSEPPVLSQNNASSTCSLSTSVPVPPSSGDTTVVAPISHAPLASINSGSAALEEPKPDMAMEVDVDDNAEDVTARSTPPPPTWLRSGNMPDYLRSVSTETAWQELVNSLFKFEALNTTTGNLPTTSRPDEVAGWIKSKKKDSPPEVDADPYGSAFMGWWIAIQPRWRLTDDASFVYEVPEGEDWRLLHKGGSAGLYTVVVALSWWITALPAEPRSLRAWSAVRDVTWVIDEIYKKVLRASQGTKRGRGDNTPDATQPGKTKRRRSG